MRFQILVMVGIGAILLADVIMLVVLVKDARRYRIENERRKTINPKLKDRYPE